MSDETQTEDEPSIEEILDSIRQIISEDDEEDGDSGAIADEETVSEDAIEPTPEEPMPEPMPDPIEELEPEKVHEPEPVEVKKPQDEDEDVLELTELVNTEENNLNVDMVEGEEEEEVEEVEEEIVVDVDSDSSEAELESEVNHEPVQEPKEIKTQLDPIEEDSLLTDKAEHAAVEAISELVRKTAVEHDGVTIEEIVRAELKPLLRDWLDKHLPNVIERLVQEELERVSKRVLED